MRPLFDGTRGHVSFIQGDSSRACHNEEDSDPENLGNDIIIFIISHTAQELVELREIVDKLEWVSRHRVEKMTPADQLRFHIVPLPARRWYLSPMDFTGPRTVEAFRLANPDFPSNIEDSEILLRYLPRRPYFHLRDDLIRWIPEYEELVQPTNQRYLLDRIWNSCESYLIDDNYDHEGPNWEYMIDLENRTLKLEGVFEHKTTFSFDELQKGMFDGWRKQNDPSESWMTELDSDVGERMSARKGLAASKLLKAVDGDEREGKRRRLNIEDEKEKGSGANSRTKAWLELIWKNAPDEDSEQIGQATL